MLRSSILASSAVFAAWTGLMSQAPQRTWPLDRATLDTTCAPCADFNRFANGGWISRASIPGALHIDGTARFQTLECGDPSPIRRVVEAFHRATGVPCVVNTSLNCQSPIAASPDDAVACLERSQLDALFLGPYLVSRERHPE